MVSPGNYNTQVFFYVPFQKDNLSEVPKNIKGYWEWISQHRGIGEGKYSWTLQTYLHLKNRGNQYKIVQVLPKKGIVISHKDFLPAYLVPPPDVFLVCIKPDRKEHPCAHHYIVQNEKDKYIHQIGQTKVSVLPFWPQPSLIEREIGRNAQCTNIAYIGRPVNLAEELRSSEWQEKLQALGFHWHTPSLEEWNDYSTIDATVSIRSFGRHRISSSPIEDPDSKPPSKLINSWLAGVPTVVGDESAYRNIKKNPLDFIEVSTEPELIDALLRLREDHELYNKMIENGKLRAREYTTETLASLWENTIEQIIGPSYEKWRRASRTRRTFSNITSMMKYLANPGNILDWIGVLLRLHRKKG
mgnify:CR=1 FL=1